MLRVVTVFKNVDNLLIRHYCVECAELSLDDRATLVAGVPQAVYENMGSPAKPLLALRDIERKADLSSSIVAAADSAVLPENSIQGATAKYEQSLRSRCATFATFKRQYKEGLTPRRGC